MIHCGNEYYEHSIGKARVKHLWYVCRWYTGDSNGSRPTHCLPNQVVTVCHTEKFTLSLRLILIIVRLYHRHTI
jgi:hypothetical protein